MTLTVHEVAAYWAGRPLPGTDYVPCCDAGEPDCFACGAWGRYDGEAWGREHSWERGVSLEMAHVVPRSLGGPREPANLVLLCHVCHLAAPDTAEARYMWQWLAAHPRTGDHVALFLGGADFRERATSYTGPAQEIVQALVSFSDSELKSIWGAVQVADRDALLGFSHHFGRGPIVSAATWRAVLGDLLCRSRRQARECWRKLALIQGTFFTDL